MKLKFKRSRDIRWAFSPGFETLKRTAGVHYHFYRRFFNFCSMGTIICIISLLSWGCTEGGIRMSNNVYLCAPRTPRQAKSHKNPLTSLVILSVQLWYYTMQCFPYKSIIPLRLLKHVIWTAFTRNKSNHCDICKIRAFKACLP